MNKLLATTLVSIGLAAAVPATLAQTAGPAADAGKSQAAQRQFERRPAMTPSERVEARLAYMRTALKITAAQQAQWDAYANVQRKHAAAMEKRFQERRAQMGQRPADGKRPTAVEQHQRQRDRMVTATQRLDELLAVEKPLYATLSPDQQRVADEVLGGRGGARGGHRRFAHRGEFGRV
jgi:protein CpxP